MQLQLQYALVETLKTIAGVIAIGWYTIFGEEDNLITEQKSV